MTADDTSYDPANQGPVQHTGPEHDADEQPAGARGAQNEHGLKGKIAQAVNAVTGRDLDAASPEENEAGAQAGPGGTDGH